MSNDIRFHTFLTKGFEGESDDEKRIVKGYISVEVVDRQDEFIAIQELAKVMPVYMKGLAPFSDTHSNRMVGKADGWEVSEYEGHPAIKVWGHIFKQDGVTLYDKVWQMIKSGEYRGFSIGGASRTKTPIFKDGRYAMELKNLEIYEIAICKSPANQFAIIDYVNAFAKGMPEGMIKNNDGRQMIQCTSIDCIVSKAIDTDVDVDVDHTGSESNSYTLKVKIDTEDADFQKIITDIVRKEILASGGGGISQKEEVKKEKTEPPYIPDGVKPDDKVEKDKKDVEEAIEREHELTGDKPSPKEEKVHEQVISETKKDHIPGEHEGLEFPKKKNISKAVSDETVAQLSKILKQ